MFKSLGSVRYLLLLLFFFLYIVPEQIVLTEGKVS